MRTVKLIGVGVSSGAAVGHAFIIDRRSVQEPRRHLQDSEIAAEIARLHDAVQRSDHQLSDIRAKLGNQPQEHTLIIEAHRLMLTDPTLLGGAEQLIRDEQINAEWAVRRVIKQLAAAFDMLDDPYFKERRSDVDFVGNRIIQNLLGQSTDLTTVPPPGSIVVTHDLSPADAMVLLNGHTVAGIVAGEGGRTSHTAIVARALEVPAVLGVENLADVIGKDDVIALDGFTGVVLVNPTESDRRAFLEVRRRYLEEEEAALATRELEATTTDGHSVTLRANIELIEEIPSVVSHGANGVGLYRTEFLYLNRRDPPTEEEHYETYRKLLESLPGRQVTVRTFDLGGEKVMPGRARAEANPSLGLRAIRYCLAHPEMFLPQLRALWRASVHGNLRVMFPLVSGIGELRRAKRFAEEARLQVIADGYDVADSLPFGIMVETPGAAMLADELAKEAAFFAIGTNDLIQYTLAIDRRNPDVAYLYQPLHPSVLRLLKHILDAANVEGISVSICGEMAGDPAYTAILIALGFEELSMSGTSIPMVKRIIRSLSRAEAADLYDHAIRLKAGPDIEAYVRSEMARRFPEICGRLPEMRPAPEDGPELSYSPS
jgi:phosphotransferase system enzyme I (PtsI)